MTKQQRFIRALEARGYTHYANARTAKYYEMVFRGADADQALTQGEHRILLGKAGAIRLTRSNIANSMDISGRWEARLLGDKIG